MANMEQVQIVKQGRDAVARWREQHANESMDLNGAYLSHARLPQVDLRGADVRNSDLMGAILARANLSGCRLNPAHMYRADLRRADLSRSLLNGANLRGANLTGANLQGSDLDRAILSDANLTGADLSGANLARVSLVGANLTDANLKGANLNRAALTRANLTNAELSGTDFYEAVFNKAVLSGAKFADSILGYTVFENCDLSGAQGLDRVRHDAPSTIGMDTFFRSGGRVPEAFLQGSGAPESILAVQRSLQGGPGLGGDCFIACAAADVPFATMLQQDLRALGVRSWVFAENFRGNPLVERHSTSDQEEVERHVRAYDRLMVVCSAAGLDSETVRNDIVHAQEQQQARNQWLLFLVASDGTMVPARSRVARTLAEQHVVFDLRGRESDAQTYQKELARLAEGLKSAQPAAAGAPVMAAGGGDPNQL
ncbi:MAG TPA: toll/interleukin-1 receptor domain-containing protein [Dehalococcoidia bacterium]|nr:toll/interleukin-1 receptor domain-containing protein [Dehalococcoidia bacterium]